VFISVYIWEKFTVLTDRKEKENKPDNARRVENVQIARNTTRALFAAFYKENRTKNKEARGGEGRFGGLYMLFIQ
jgi:hypothetical protein